MTLITKVLNNNLDNDIIFYSTLIGFVGFIGYSLISEYFSKSYTEKGVQTDAENNLSDTPNQIIQENLTSIDTLSPVSSTSSLIPTTSEVGIQTIAGNVTPVNIEVIPNPDIVGRVIDPSNAEYLAAKADQLNALDPFLATPWTPERVLTMIDQLGIVNNLFN
jgi:hypothetical protein